MVRPPVRKTPANPTGIDPDHEQRVRERAYHLWEAEGKPHGRDVEFWERARALEAAEADAAAEPPATKPKAPRKQAAEPASVRKSMAEAPGAADNAADMKAGAAPNRKLRAKPKKPA